MIALSSLSLRAAEKVDFNRDVLPILSTKCFECHGPDAGARKAKLRLDMREDATAERDGKPAIVPKQPAKSELVVRITTTEEDDRMPPRDKGERLAPEQVEILRKWVKEGAEYSEHWAFVPPKQAPLPRVRNTRWVRAPIDHFVLYRLEQEKIKPAAKASRETLIRRATLDLIGLPPTPEEIEAFLADKSPKAYERLIDRLLTSPY